MRKEMELEYKKKGIVISPAAAQVMQHHIEE